MWYRVMLASLVCLPVWGDYYYTEYYWSCSMTYPPGGTSCDVPWDMSPGLPGYELVDLFISWSSTGSTEYTYATVDPEFLGYTPDLYFWARAWLNVAYPGHTYTAEVYGVDLYDTGGGWRTIYGTDARSGSSDKSGLPTSITIDYAYIFFASMGTDTVYQWTNVDVNFSAFYTYFVEDPIPDPPPDPILTPEGGTLGQVGGALLGLSVWLGRRWRRSGNRPVG